MKVDKARSKTNKKLEKMEKEISNIYKRSSRDIAKKWNAYMAESEKKIQPLQQDYDAAKKSGDKELIKETGKKLGQAKREQTLQNNYYKDMLNATTEQLAKVNQTALDYINEKMPEIYTINYNQASDIATNVGIKYNLINEDVVKRRVIDGDIKLPNKNVNIPKDERWNTKQLNSSVLQGIIQGESMQKIADRIYPIVDRNKNAAIRNARTMVTGAENVGRLDSYKQLQDDGLVLRKVWMATPDGRTRDWHIDMEGQEVELDQYFIDGLGNELEYPGDPGGAPETVYNCRCTMVTNVIGFRRNDRRYD